MRVRLYQFSVAEEIDAYKIMQGANVYSLQTLLFPHWLSSHLRLDLRPPPQPAPSAHLDRLFSIHTSTWSFLFLLGSFLATQPRAISGRVCARGIERTGSICFQHFARGSKHHHRRHLYSYWGPFIDGCCSTIRTINNVSTPKQIHSLFMLVSYIASCCYWVLFFPA